ncbi:MAG: HAMP domain-containing protein, partial [Proteobacteria bacterium]|nr:HAMP domain-containing protein [Pseudomonadota bacterium]
MNRSKISLRTEIVINILILVVAAIATVGIMVIKIFENNIVDMRSADGEILASYIQKSVEDSLTRKGEILLKGLQPTIDTFARQSRAKNILIVDNNFKVLAHTNLKEIGKVSNDEKLMDAVKFNMISAHVKERNGTFFMSQYDSISFFRPIRFNGKTIGAIKTVFPLDEMNDLLVRTRYLVLFFLLFDSILLIIFGNFLLSRLIVKPLQKFLKASERIATGDLSHRLDYKSDNELGQLSLTFNSMAEKLEEHVGYLERINRELKQAQQELVRSEKLASVGRLAAGIAHEVGNPLGAILGYTDMLIKGVDGEETRSDFLKRIEKEIKRIDVIIKELLDYSRPTRLEIKTMDVNTVISDTVSLLSHQKSFGEISINMDFADHLPQVMADDNQFQQVLINIMLNAVDAMKDGGDLNIATEIFSPKEDDSDFPRRRRSDPHNESFTPGRHDLVQTMNERVKITIEDNGSGIKKEDLEFIFDPFFTTKEPGKGTGLGLSISQRIIETFNGKLEVRSTLGRGTAFMIYL